MEDLRMKARYTMSDAENTFEAILTRMKANLALDITDIEGTWTGDMLQTVANELARIYSCEIKPIYDKAFVSTAKGEDLDKCCADYGIYRNQATYAEGTVKIRGKPGIYKDLKVRADDIIFNLPKAVIIPQTGEVTVYCICEIPGEKGNVGAGAIDRLVSADSDIESVSNETAASGGYDAESDKSLRSRTLEHISEPATSGNIANYREWALDVTGVGEVQIFDLARGNGTVDVVVIAEGNKVASLQLLEAVQEQIEKYRPIGADVEVLAAQSFDIFISVTVTAKKGYTADAIKEMLYEVIKDYLAGLTRRNARISYIKLADVIFGCEGIEDISDYTLNGEKRSIVLMDRYFPVAVMPTVRLEE